MITVGCGTSHLQGEYRSIPVFLFVFLATGILKGYDPLLNLVLDGCSEHIQGSIQAV